MIEARLNGQFPPGYATTDRVDLSQLMRSGTARPPEKPAVRIADARPLQAAATSDAAFLAAHGFVLLDAPVAIADWGDTAEVAATYFPLIDRLIGERLFPGRRTIIRHPPAIVRRGAGTASPQYGLGVHQDHGTSADDFEHNLAAFTAADMAATWRRRFERDDVAEFVVLDFWRTTNMAAPLAHMPLALCDAASVDPADIVPTTLEGIAPGGPTRHVGLRANPGQLWFYYPAMTPDEMLAFKLLHIVRDDPSAAYRSCFHTAVDDPATPADAQPRQSCEHRVSIFLLKD